MDPSEVAPQDSSEVAPQDSSEDAPQPWESPHKEVQEARRILRDKFWAETIPVGEIIHNLCEERNALKEKLQESIASQRQAEGLQKEAEKEIQSVRKAVRDTQKRQRDMVQKLEEEANIKAKKEFDKQRQNMQKKLNKMKEKNTKLLEQNALNEARIESLAEQAKKIMNANKAYDIQFPELKQENEKLKRDLLVANGANDELIAAFKNYKALEANLNKLKVTYLKTAQANQLLKGEHEELIKVHNKLVAEYNRLLNTSRQLAERINQSGGNKKLENLRQLRL